MDSLEMQRPNTADTVALRELLKPLFRWWWLLAACTLLAGISSAIYTRQQPLVYQSTTTLMVGTALLDPNPNSGEFGMASQLALAYAGMAERSTLRDAVKKALGIEWLPEYAVRNIATTQFLEIAVVDTVPARAQIVAQTLADQLILRSPGASTQQGRQQFIEEQLTQLEQGIIDTKAEIERLELDLAGLFSARQIADTRTQVEALRTKLGSLQANYASLLESSRRQATNVLQVVEPATLPQRPLNSDLSRNVVIAMAIGFALAAAAAYFLELIDDTLKTEHDIQHWFGLAALGAIPKGARSPAGGSVLEMASAQRTPQSDAYAALCLNVQAAVRREGVRTLLVTCPALEDGRPGIAANLCVELAHAGVPVVLVDADLHQPSQHHLFGLPNRAGLTTALTEPGGEPELFLQRAAQAGLGVITSGPLPGNPPALLGAPRMRELVHRLRDQADLVVLDTPPIGALVDTAILATECDAVLLVAAAGRTTRDRMQQALRVLSRLGVPVLGVVLYNVQGGRAGDQIQYGHRPRQAVPDSAVSGARSKMHHNGVDKHDAPVPSLDDGAPKAQRNPFSRR